MCCMWLIENVGCKNSPSVYKTSHNFIGLYLHNQDMHWQSEKNLLNSDISSTCPHSMVNFGPLMVEIGWRVCGTPANFNRFRVFASLLHRRHSTEVSQTLHDVWPSPGLVHYIYIFGGSCPLPEFCQVQSSLCMQVLCFSILAVLLHNSGAVGIIQTLRRGTKNGITELLLLVIFNREHHL